MRWEVIPAASGCRLKLSHTFTADCVLSEIVGFAGGWHAFLNAIPAGSDGKFVEYADEKDFDAGYRARLPGRAATGQESGILKMPGVRMERLLPGPIERVWEHLTNTRLLKAWFGEKSNIEPPARRGSATDGWPHPRHNHAVASATSPELHLELCSLPVSPPDAASAYPESYLMLTLEPRGDSVLLVLSHLPVLERFEKQNAMDPHRHTRRPQRPHAAGVFGA